MAQTDPEGTAEKNYGPHAIGMIMGACIGSYIEYGVTRDEFVELASGMYDGILALLNEQNLAPGFGQLCDDALYLRQMEFEGILHSSEMSTEERLQKLAQSFRSLMRLVRDEM